MFHFRVCFIYIVFYLFSSCSNDLIFSETYSFPQSTWTKDGFVDFQAKISDIKSQYKIRISITHDITYQFSNLMMGLQITTPDGAERTTGLDIALKDDQRNFNGQVQGENVVYEFDALKQTGFSQQGIYTFRLQHYMPFSFVSGLKELRLEIIKIRE